ncbi:hypothetical protein JTB14_004507 [Gonioctena quinquepunctata]|nr:hypothetical protein JTB14_004507 [Gonioctena quinquepunctata]
MRQTTRLVWLSIGFSVSFAYLKKEDFGPILAPLAEESHNKCLAITGTSEKFIDYMRQGIFVDDEKLKRYVLCLIIMTDALSPTFEANWKRVEYLMPLKLKNGPQNVMGCLKEPRVWASSIIELHKITAILMMKKKHLVKILKIFIHVLRMEFSRLILKHEKEKYEVMWEFLKCFYKKDPENFLIY